MTNEDDDAKEFDLFGGSIKISLPKNLVDASQMRQVPDEQEVFVSPDSSNLSVIVEVLEAVDPDNDSEFLQLNQTQSSGLKDSHPTSVIKYHFYSLAHDNSATTSSINSIEFPADLSYFTKDLGTIKHTPEPILLHGLQLVSKFNRPDSEADQVYIWMALWRLRGIGSGDLGTDLVLTFNLPDLSNAHLTQDQSFQHSLQRVSKLFHMAAKSLSIVDWLLFA
ncbi:hypothetical protein O181_064577 [Austropuccinia psidii MF-1]|uniref:Uncharacterized protein n=1 Tax=Austropuccinia psidii MF-1 TaxID=1389203 RepID=A0A9Q3I2G5_9BASI|nr:hypothetical protein [Austropuccinia psidii MF-1]